MIIEAGQTAWVLMRMRRWVDQDGEMMGQRIPMAQPDDGAVWFLCVYPTRELAEAQSEGGKYLVVEIRAREAKP